MPEPWRIQYARVRAALLAEKDRPCADCGQQLPPDRMHFHHTGTKNGKVSAQRSVGAVQREAALCVVLCQPCHARRHHHRRSAGSPTH